MKKILLIVPLLFLIGLVFGTNLNAQVLSEGFEGAGIPTGWTQETVTGTYTWSTVGTNGSGNISARTGSKMAEFRNESSGATTKLVTPQLDLSTLTNPELNFFFANENWVGDIDELRLYYKADAGDPWTQMGLSYTTEHATWTEVTIILPSPSVDYYIAFEGTSNWARGLNIDDVIVDEAPTCPKPSVLAQTAITSSSVDVEWTENGSATTWNIEVGPTGFTPGTSTEVVADNGNTTQTSSLSGLSGNTSYDVYVQADCGPGDQSVWHGPLTILTPPAVQIPVSTFPWNEDFETGGTEWTYLNGTGVVNTWNVGSAIANGGSNSLYISKDNGVTHEYDNSKYSVVHAYRDVTLPSGIVAAELSFDFIGRAESCCDYLRVWAVPLTYSPTPGTSSSNMITTNGSEPTGRIQIGLVNFNNTSSFEHKTIQIPVAYFGEDFRIVFEWKNDGSTGPNPPAALDNVSIQTYTCFGPTAALSSDLGKFGATVSWTNTNSSPNFIVEYGPAGFTPGTGTTVTVADTFAVLTGLISDQDYDYYVSGECSDATFSSQVKGSFTTLVACAVPTSFALVEKTESSVELTWMVPIGGASTFTIEYGPAGFTQGTGTTVTAPPTVITGLDSDTEYDFYVIAECGGANGPSQPAGPVTVTTDIACEQPTNIVVSDIESNSVVVTWDGHSATNWVIEYDTLGFTQGSSVNAEVNTSTIPHTLTGLDPEATYSIYVWADCGGGELSSVSGPVSFTTLPACPVPTNLTVSDIGADTAVVEWDAHGTTNWVIEFDTLGFTPGNGTSIIENTTDNPFTLTGLSPEQTYDVFVWADCGTDGLSDTLGPVNFTTQPICPAPTNLVVSQIGADTAVVTWEGNGPTSWVIEYGIVGFGLGNGSSISTTDNPETLTGLTPETVHSVYIWADCGTDGLSDTLGPINFTTQPTCLAPTTLTATDITATSADLGWTESGSAAEWQVQYGPAGFTLGSGTIESATANPHPITGLTGNTDYGFYVRSVCAVGDTSEWSGPFAFTTPCSPYTVPYFEGFETDYTHNTAVAGCLSQESITGSDTWTANNTLTTYNRTPRTGGWNTFLIYGEEDWLFIPIELVGGTSYTTELYARQDATSGANIMISYGSANTSADMTNSIVASTAVTNGNYQLVKGTFTPATTDVYYVGIKATTTYTPYYISVDDIAIYETPSCLAPSDIIVSDLSAASATISWTNNNASTDFNLEYGPAGFTPGTGTMLNGVTNPFTITGLDDTTSYEVRVQSDCGGGDLSFWTTESFTTELLPIPALDFCEDFNVGSPTADFWTVLDANNDGEEWGIASFTNDPNDRFYFYDTYWGDADDYLISPAITLTGVEAVNFKYMVYDAYYTPYPTEFQVLLSTTGKDPSDFTVTLMDLAAYSNTDWLDTSIDLTNYTGDVYIAFHIPNTAGDNSEIFIDDVCFGECNVTSGTDGSIEVCRLDGAIDLTNGIITHDNEDGRWVYAANQALIQDDTMFAIGTLPAGAYEVLYIVDGLCNNASDTTVATINVFGASSAGDGGSITACKNEPINLFAALSGNVDMGGDWYDHNNNLLPTSQPTAPSLEAQYNYKYVASNGVCPADTAIVEVNVGNCTWDVKDEMFTDVSVYPNPATSQLNIVNPSNTSSLKVEMLDMNGRVVLVENKALNNASEATLAIDHLERGIYTLRIYNDEGQRTFKVVKQ